MSADDYVTLINGPTLPACVLRLMWGLEDRGFRFRLDGVSALIVEPEDQLTDEDIEAIRRWRYHIAAAVEYQPPKVH